MRSATLFVPLLAALAAAIPQQGRYYTTVGNKYTGGGCTDQALLYADPIFGNGNVCQRLNRFDDTPAVVSYKLLSAAAGCTVKVYSDATCSGTAYAAPIGQSVFVTCPLP